MLLLLIGGEVLLLLKYRIKIKVLLLLVAPVVLIYQLSAPGVSFFRADSVHFHLLLYLLRIVSEHVTSNSRKLMLVSSITTVSCFRKIERS